MTEVRVQRSVFDTTDPDEAHDYLRSTYVDHAVRLSGSTAMFRFRHHVAGDDGFFVARYEHSMNCQVDTEPFGYLLVGQMISGRLRLAGGRAEAAPGPGELFVLDPSQPMNIHWDAFHAGLLKLDLGIVNRVAGELIGAVPRGGVRFGVARVRSAEKARHWQGLVRHLTHDFLTNEHACSSPLIHAQTMRLIAATVLDTFPNTTAAAEPARPGRADASVVHRAVAFIDEHAAEPIGVTEIAAAVRVGPRTLQEAFRRHLDTTPMSQLRRTRLARAHAELCAADPGSGGTVAAIASRWGFANPGRFAVMYREAYGRSPSETLHS